MLPSVGYFKSIICPYFENDSQCERPYCQFRHDNLPAKKQPPKPGPKIQEPGSSSTIEQMVSEAVCKVLSENGQFLENFDASKIMEIVGQHKLVEKAVEHCIANPIVEKIPEPPAPSSKSKNHKTYTIPKGTPAYTPTPIAVLKKKVNSVPAKVENYIPTNSSGKKASPVVDYKPSKVSPIKTTADAYCPSGYSTHPSVDYTPSSRDANNVVDDSYTPLSDSSDKKTPDYKPSKVSPIKSTADTYCPSGYSTQPGVDYTPSSRGADNFINDLYTPPSMNSDFTPDFVSYEPTICEFSSSEPTYSPSCSNVENQLLNYSPSSIITLTAEPTYCPAPSSTGQQLADYTPSKRDELELTMEQLFDMPDEFEPQPIKSAASPSSSSSSSRKKSKDKEREREKEKKRRREKEKSKEKEKKSSKHSSSKSSKRTEPNSDLSDVDEEECYRIFKEYRPDSSSTNGQSAKKKSAVKEEDNKKRKSDETPANNESEAVIPLKKMRVAHGPVDPTRPAPPSRPALVKPPARLSPGMMMIERFKQHQEAKAAANAAANTSSSSSSSSATPSPASTSKPMARFGPFPPPPLPGGDKKRIAHVPNLPTLLTASKPKIPTGSLLSQAAKKLPPPKVPPQNLPRPTIKAELGCRVPANVRQKYLNVLVDEMLKLYDRQEDAFERAVEEETASYAKSKSKVVYVNVVTNLVQRIRREGTGNSSAGAGAQQQHKVQSHSAMLAGKGGATVSWSIEKPRSGAKLDSNLFKGAAFYKLLLRHVLTLEQQDFNGYPRPDPKEKGRALINTVNKFRQKPVGSFNLSADERICDRCSTVYKINSKGLPIKQDDSCSYHWGKPFARRGQTTYSCCKGETNADGCSVAKYHVSDILSENLKGGFVRTMSKGGDCDGVFALDCEMCYTTDGPELTRVTVIDTDLKTVYETLVRPDNPILDYNTRFSGITEEDLSGVRTTIRDVQAVLLSKFTDKTILIGHSFDSDLKALRLIHDTVIDTSVVFPHSRGPPYKKALRTLCGDILQKIIQNDVGGHDSAEDAIACMELMVWKVKQDLKMLK